MNLREDEGGEELTLNLTPLIDVVFQLLIFFMVATTFQEPEESLDVELPPAASGEAREPELEELVIHLLRDGSCRLAGQEVDDAARAAERDPETPVTIRGDREVKHERVVSVMDACGLAGLRSLSLGTLDAGAGERP